MSKTKNESQEQEKQQEIQYLKKQLVSSKKYSSNKDLLNVLLEENKKYTLDEIDNMIKEFKERKV